MYMVDHGCLDLKNDILQIGVDEKNMDTAFAQITLRIISNQVSVVLCWEVSGQIAGSVVILPSVSIVAHDFNAYIFWIM